MLLTLFFKEGKKMKISLIKALKSPFETRVVIPCIVWAAMAIWASLYINITYNLPFIQNMTIHCLMILPYFTALMIMIGYFSSFSHNVITNQNPLFKVPYITLFKKGIKTFLFTLSSYLILFPSIFLSLVALKYMPVGIGLFTFILIQSFTFLYLLSAWTQFTDTFCIGEPLKLITLSKFLGKNWPSYLKITLYMIIAIFILIIPTQLIQSTLIELSKQNSIIAYPGIFICSFAYLYPTFVVLHLMAQGYAGIKNTTLSTTQQPTAQTEKTASKPNSEKRNSQGTKKQPKSTSKKVSTHKTKSIKKVK